MATETTDKSLDEIRREVIESRNLVIKTDNLLKNLHAELKLVGKRQEDFARRQWFSSGVTYLGFLALCIAGAVMISNARIATVASDRDRSDKQLAELNAQVDKLKSDAQSLAASEQRASEVYRQMTTLSGDDRLKAVDALGKLDLSKVSPFVQRALQDRAALLRKEVGQGMFDRGRASYRRNEWGPAAEELQRFLALNPPEDDAFEATYALGHSLFQQRKNDQAATVLAKYVAGDKKLKNRDYAMIMLIQAYDATAQKEKAIELAKDGLAQYPASEFAQGFRLRLKRGEIEKAASPAAAPAPAAPAPAPAPKTP